MFKNIKGFFPYIIASFVIILTVAILFRIKYTDGFVVPLDEGNYHRVASLMSDGLKSGKFLDPFEVFREVVVDINVGFYYYTALHYLIIKDKFTVVVTNAILHIIASIILYVFTSRNFGEREAKFVFLCYLFNPHLVYWSSLLMKEILITFLISALLYSVYSMEQATENKKLGYIIIISILIGITFLRFYIGFLLVLTLVIISLLGKDYKIKKGIVYLTCFIGILIIFYYFTPLKGAFNHIFSQGIVKGIYKEQVILWEEATKFLPNFDSSYSLKSFITSLSYFILAPSPFNWAGDGNKYMFYGNLLWYFLLPFYVVGTLIILADRKLRNKYIFLWVFPLLVILYFIVFPEKGAARHRAMIIPFVTILSSIGLFQRYEYKKLVVIAVLIFIVVAIVVREVMRL